MASESYQSNRPGDSKFKQSMVNGGKDKTVGVTKGGHCGGTKGGKTNEQMLKLGEGMAKAAANGKPY